MKESIKLKISKNDLIKLLEKYYEEKLGKKIKISITTTEECFGLYEVEELVTRIKFETKETMMDEVLGKIEHTITHSLDESDIKEVLSEHLRSKGYTVDTINYEQYRDYDRRTYGFRGIEATLERTGPIKRFKLWK